MKKICEAAEQLEIEGQLIANALSEYNPGLNKKRIPLDCIQHDIAVLMQRYSRIYAEIGEKIKWGKED